MSTATSDHDQLVKEIVKVGQALSLHKHRLQAAINGGCKADVIADHRDRVARVQADYDRLDTQIRAITDTWAWS